MDFTFTEEQRLAAQSLRELLADHCQGSDLRRAAEAKGAEAFAAACSERRGQLGELGLAGLFVPAEQGGLGLSPIDAVLLAEEAGRAALPEPLLDVEAVVHPLLALLTGDAARGVLAASLEGRALVLARLPACDFVASASQADYLLAGRSSTELALYRAADVDIRARESVDPLRRLGEIHLGSAQPIAALVGAQAELAWEHAQLRSIALDAAQLLGLASRMADIAVAYALERKQFGKVIGSNQAVKHALADVMVKIEFARPVVYAAAAGLAALRVSHAFVAAADAADRAARTAIQVHGAMGYSWEVDLQFYAKRAWALGGLHGGRARHFAKLHAALRSGEITPGPDQLFALQGSSVQAPFN